MWKFFVHLVGVGVGELVCFLFVFLFLLSSSLILHLALIGLVAYVANHSLSFIKLLHSLDGVILIKLDLLRLAFHLSQVLVRRATSCLSWSFSFATSCVHVSTTTFSIQTWLHKGESKYKSLQELEASFLDMSKIELFFLGALVRVVPTA